MLGITFQKYKLMFTLLFLILIGLILVILFPIYWTIISSFKHNVEMFKVPPTWFPRAPTLDNYREVFAGTFPQNLLNSLTVSFVSTIICIMIGAPAAYSFSHYRFRFSYILFFLILLVRMFPAVSFIVPFYLMFQTIGLYNTRLALIFSNLTFQLPFVVWILGGFFSSIPKQLEEVARIDGCSRTQAFVYIILPLIAPGLSVSALFAFIFSWNEFPYALVLTATSSAKTATVKLAETITAYQIFWGQMTAAAIVFTLPILALTFFMQRYMVNALLAGAIKG